MSFYLALLGSNTRYYRPANILLSPKNVPVLVDFGFAEKYDVQSCEAFHSNLSYGTPEVSSMNLYQTHFNRL